MQISEIPALLQKAWAASGTKNTIPVASQIGVTPGAASLTDGFPPLTMTPLAAGGIPPFGADANGILNWLSAICQWGNAGGMYTYDAAFSTAIGGYPKGSTLLKADYSGSWFCLTDNNTTNPDAGGAGWTTYGGMAYVSTAPGTQINGTDLVYAKDRDQILRWQTIGTFTGYASPQVGIFHWGSDTTPRPFQELLIGQTIDATQPKYAALLAYLNSAGYVVPSASWAAGTFNFVNLGSNQYKMADMRNQFIRATGTNADTANARVPGSSQMDAVQKMVGSAPSMLRKQGSAAPSGVFVSQGIANNGAAAGPGYNFQEEGISFDSSQSSRSSSETRGTNAALVPMICL